MADDLEDAPWATKPAVADKQPDLPDAPWGGEQKTPEQPAEKPALNWSDVPGEAAKNLLPSIGNVYKQAFQTVAHPIDTAQALGNTALGFAQKLPGMKSAVASGYGANPEEPLPQEKYADALTNHLSERYGGMENLKNTMAHDPAGFALDLSTVLGGGASLAGKVPALAGAARAVGTAATAIDPFMAPISAVKGLGRVGSELVGNLATRTGSRPIREGYNAGVEGGAAQDAFQSNLRGNAPADSAVREARDALTSMRAEKNLAYKTGMVDVGNDASVLSFKDIDKALDEANKIKSFSGRSGQGPTQQLSPKTAGVRQEIQEAVDHWKSLDPNDFHTPVGMDALKQQIGDIKDSLQYNTPERLVAEKAYSAIRQTIAKQAPSYDNVMKGYENASNQINEISKTLSLNPKASVDTTLRKLQSVMRDNVTTNYGKRADLAETLATHGAPNLMPKLAGQTMQSWFPRGFGPYAEAGWIGSALYSMHPGMWAAVPAIAAVHSPRVVGEAANLAGRAVGTIPKSVRENIEPIMQGARAVGADEQIQQPQYKKGGAVARLERSRKRLQNISV